MSLLLQDYVLAYKKDFTNERYRNEFKAAAVLVPDGHFCFGTTSGLSYSRREYGTGQENCLGDELTRLLQ